MFVNRKIFINSILTRILLITSLLQISACSSLGYLLHASGGHLEIMSQRQDIKALIDTENSPDVDKQTLQEALEIREFASSELFLPNNDSYTSYVGLEREFVTWVVFATEPLSLHAKTWCFWVVGCVPYRGYFDQQKAVNFSSQLQQQGYETYIGSVPAYSTLGWFSDPLLSSMLNRGQIATAEYIFHELAHQQVYIKNDASFNEAFATAVGQLGVMQWLASNGKHETLQRYLESNNNKREIYQLIGGLREQLMQIYQSSADSETKQQLKARALIEYQQSMSDKLKAWKKYHRYKAWLLDDINNAKLNAFSTYRDLVPLFVGLFERCDKNFTQFYAAIEKMQKLDKQQRLKRLTREQC